MFAIVFTSPSFSRFHQRATHFMGAENLRSFRQHVYYSNKYKLPSPDPLRKYIFGISVCRWLTKYKRWLQLIFLLTFSVLSV